MLLQAVTTASASITAFAELDFMSTVAISRKRKITL